MRNYNIYLVISTLLLLSSAFLGLLTMLILGVFQFSVGLYLLAKFKVYPGWARKRIRNYWIMSTGYFVPFLFELEWNLLTDRLIWFWLIVPPLAIAIYQYQLIHRMAGFRKRQLEKRAFLQLYNR